MMIRLYLKSYLTLIFAAIVLLGTSKIVVASGVSGCTATDDTGCGNHSEIFAISHGYPDGTDGTINRKNDIWYRVTIAPWTPCKTESENGTCSEFIAWDGKSNGFYYQVSLSSASTPTLNATQTVVPGNGFAVDSNGGTQLRMFSLIAQLPDAITTSDAVIEVLACSHNFPQTTSCDASNSWWSDSYAASTLTPQVFSNEPFVQNDPFSELLEFPGVTGTVPNLSIPSNGVYGHELSIQPNIENASTDADEFFKRLVFINGATGEVYTNDALGAAVMLPLQEAAYTTTTANTWNTRYGATAGINLTDTDLVPINSGTIPYFVYTSAGSDLTIYGAIAYDQSETVVGCLQPGDCSFLQNSAGVAIELKPVKDLSGQMSLTMEETQFREPIRTLNWSAVKSEAVSCTNIRNPFALTAGGPDYVIQKAIDVGAGKSWPVPFESGLYYVAHMGYGNCSDNAPFCQAGGNTVRRSPKFLPVTNNEAYVTGFKLADPYQFKQDIEPSESTFVWFDNCGYGSVSTPDSAASQETQRCPLPTFTTDNNPVVQTYTLKNQYPVPIRIEKECCANWWAELSGENGCNNTDFSNQVTPPENLRSGYSMLIPQGGEIEYNTWFTEEAHVIHNAVTGEVLHKLRLHQTDNWITDCSDSQVITAIASQSGSAPEVTLTLGDPDGTVKCSDVSPYHCPWGATSTTLNGVTACVVTKTRMIVSIQDWIGNRGLTNITLNTMAWGANTHLSSTGVPGAKGGFAWTAWEGSHFIDQTTPKEGGTGLGLYFYNGRGNPGDHNGASATVVMTEPLSAPGALSGGTPATAAEGEEQRQQTGTPGIVGTVLIAGGAGGYGRVNNGGFCTEQTLNGGAGGIAINTTSTVLTVQGGQGDRSSSTGKTAGGGLGGSSHGIAGVGGSNCISDGSNCTNYAQNGVGGLAGGETWKTDGTNMLIPHWSEAIYNSGLGDLHDNESNDVCGGGMNQGGGGGGGGQRGNNGNHSGFNLVTGGGAGGTLAAGISPNASTTDAPTSRLTNPGGADGAFALTWTTSSVDDSHPCTYSSGYQAVHCAFFASDTIQEVDIASLEERATLALQRAKPEAYLDGRVYIESWGADDGGKTSVRCNDKAPHCRGPQFAGSGGYAVTSYETTDLSTLSLSVARNGQKMSNGSNHRNRRKMNHGSNHRNRNKMNHRNKFNGKNTGGHKHAGGTIPLDEYRVFGAKRRLPSATEGGNGLVVIGFSTEAGD